MGEVLKKFGKYFLLDHLAQGGMAEIYRARLAAVDGAGRLIVIKRIQAGFGANSEFLQMFKSEIKVTMGFNHPNIVQLYDFGEEQNQPYIAMELVDGKNLRQFSSRFAEMKQTFPVELAAYIIEQAASGLNYAHSFKDKISGEPLNIVHRDISPQNILISYEGNVKVIDFGIAKAATNSESTRAGVIKGKPSYLSPEQISGEVLDGRSDIFALGAVLWELLAGRKLFAGENDLAVLKLIESCQTHVKPPSTINPKVPKELDYIVLKTLAKQREKRYQTAEELQRALHKFLYAFMSEFNPSDLAYYAKDMFKSEIVEDRKKIQKLNEKVEQLLASPDVSESNGHSSDNTSNEATKVVEPRKSPAAARKEVVQLQPDRDTKVEIEMPRGPGTRPNQQQPAAPRTRSTGNHTKSIQLATTGSIPGRATTSIHTSVPQQRRASSSNNSSQSPGKFIGIGAVALIALSIVGPEFGIRIPVLSDITSEWLGGNEARVVLQGNQKGVTVAVNGQTISNSLPATLTGIPVGTPFRVTVTGPFGSFQQEITLKKGERKSIPVEFTQEAKTAQAPIATQGTTLASDKSIVLKLNLSPAGGTPSIMLNGKPVDAANPSTQVPLDSPLDLTVDRQGYKPFKSEFVLQSRQMNGLREWNMDVQLEPTRFGYLTIHTTPSANATIMIDGAAWTKKTPIENEKLPVGQYNIRLTNDVLGMEKNINVTIEEGKSLPIDERLEIKN